MLIKETKPENTQLDLWWKIINNFNFFSLLYISSYHERLTKIMREVWDAILLWIQEFEEINYEKFLFFLYHLIIKGWQ